MEERSNLNEVILKSSIVERTFSDIVECCCGSNVFEVEGRGEVEFWLCWK
jgi:hypothetical protein